MAFLFSNKKRNKNQGISILSEAEIQKKLYGEFSTEARPLAGDSDHAVFKGPEIIPSPGHEKQETPADLFSSKKDLLVGHELDVSEPKESDAASKHVSPYEVKKKGDFSQPWATSTDPYARFHSHSFEESVKKSNVFSRLRNLTNHGLEFLAGFFDSKRIVARRVLYWSGAVLAILLLFGSVNSLNSNRETAMKSKYKIDNEVTKEIAASKESAPVVNQEKVSLPSPEKAISRPVVITPVPVKTKTLPTTSVVTKENTSLPYVIQVVTYPTQEDADRVMTTLKQEHLKVFVKENKRLSGRVFYVVYIGGFRTEAEAQAHLLSFRAKSVARPFQDAFVKRNS